MDLSQTPAPSDTTVFCTTKTTIEPVVEVGILEITTSGQSEFSDEDDSDLEYWKKGKGKTPLTGGIDPGRASSSRNTTSSTYGSSSSHRSPANPPRVANLQYSATSTSSKDKDKAKKGK